MSSSAANTTNHPALGDDYQMIATGTEIPGVTGQELERKENNINKKDEKEIRNSN